MALSASGQQAIIKHYEAMAKHNGAQFSQGAAFTVSPANVQRFVDDVKKNIDLMKKINYRVVPHPSANDVAFGLKRPGHGRATPPVKRADNRIKNSYACKCIETVLFNL